MTHGDPPRDEDPDPEARRLGRALLHAVESLGESLRDLVELPPEFAPAARALAEGRSRVPFDGDAVDFPSRVRARAAAVDHPRAGDPALSLRAWLGASITAWLAEGLESVPPSLAAFGLRPAVTRCAEARAAVRALEAPRASAFADWYAAGLAPHEARLYRAASALALDEAVDRWCSLGCDGDLGAYVSTWQRSAAGWAEATLGASVEVSAADLGRLRALPEIVAEYRRRRLPRSELPSRVASRLGVTVDEAARLLDAESAVRARRDPEAVTRRRWTVVRPIAEAVAALSRELGREPTVDETAARAGVHPVLVELVVDALDG